MGLLDGLLGGTEELAIFLIALLVVVILILVAGRKDDDPDGTRTQARYLGAITIVALFVALLAFFGMIHALTDLIVDKAPRGGGNALPKQLRDILDQIPGLGGTGGGGAAARTDDADYQTAARALLLGLAASAVFVFHIRRARTLANPDAFPEQAPGRVARAALYGACFIAAIIVIVAATQGFYGFFKVIAPGTFGSGDDDIVRQQGISDIISFAFLGLGATLIFLRSWHWLPEHRAVESTE
jgi:drug/metabolite transporter (DMT)-like permease